MKKSISQFLLFAVLSLMVIIDPVKAQTTVVEKKTDSVARLAIHYMNSNLPDSVYALTGDFFKSKIPQGTFSTIYSNQLSTLLPFTKVDFVSSTDNINTYKVTGKIPLTYRASLDDKNKLMNFSFVPYNND